MNPNNERKHRLGFRPQVIIILLLTISLLAACSDVNPPINPTLAKTMIAAVTPTPAVEIQANPTAAANGSINHSFPEIIKPGARYLFYIHGRIIEDQGVPAVSPEFGTYEFDETLRYFAAAGFNVIAEVRSANTDVDEYSDKVISQINTLLQQGVPRENITVVGFSKGGWIAAFTSAKLRNPGVNFVLIAICGDELNAISTISLAGRILSLYEASDEFGSTCKSLVERSPGVTGFDEIEFNTGLRHGAFYTADSTWLDPLISWLLEEGS
jgi:hypothetical protein